MPASSELSPQSLDPSHTHWGEIQILLVSHCTVTGGHDLSAVEEEIGKNERWGELMADEYFFFKTKLFLKLYIRLYGQCGMININM